MIGNPSPMMLCAIAIEFVAEYDVHRMIDQDTVENIIRRGRVRRLPVTARQLRKDQSLERFRLRQRFPRGPSSVTA